MKKGALILSMILCFAMCSFGQEPTETKESGVVFDTLVYNYGTIEKGSDGKCSFAFKNTSDTPLILTNVAASCGCTVPSWPKNPINPGESSAIDVKYNTNNVGFFSKRITVTTNKQATPIILTITGKVVDPTQTTVEPQVK